VKLPADLRRDVYRERPYEEQSTWLARIRSAGDPEAEFSRERAFGASACCAAKRTSRPPKNAGLPAATTKVSTERTTSERLGAVFITSHQRGVPPRGPQSHPCGWKTNVGRLCAYRPTCPAFPVGD
jgi:hypothetical protein